MKKICALVLVLLLALSATAETGFEDYSDEMLVYFLDLVRTELALRESSVKAEPDAVLIDQDGVKLYISGEPYVLGYVGCYLYIPCVIINSTGTTVSIGAETASVNGWQVGVSVGSCAAGKKAKVDMYLNLEDADCAGIEDVEELLIAFYLYDLDNFNTIAELDEKLITLN